MGIYDDDIVSIKEELEELERHSVKESPQHEYDWGCLPWIIFIIIIKAVYYLCFDH